MSWVPNGVSHGHSCSDQGFFRIIKNQGGGDPSPKTPSPPPQTKVTIVGKNEIHNRENLVRSLLVHQVLGPKPPPPPPPPCSKEALVRTVFLRTLLFAGQGGGGYTTVTVFGACPVSPSRFLHFVLFPSQVQCSQQQWPFASYYLHLCRSAAGVVRGLPLSLTTQ